MSKESKQALIHADREKQKEMERKSYKVEWRTKNSQELYRYK